MHYLIPETSQSGRPFTTPKGHAPAWTSKVSNPYQSLYKQIFELYLIQVKWHAASALEPASYASLMNDKTAVVHTLGVLLEGGYKASLQRGDIIGLATSFVRNMGLESRNPLTSEDKTGEYETINRDSGKFTGAPNLRRHVLLIIISLELCACLRPTLQPRLQARAKSRSSTYRQKTASGRSYLADTLTPRWKQKHRLPTCAKRRPNGFAMYLFGRVSGATHASLPKLGTD